MGGWRQESGRPATAPECTVVGEPLEASPFARGPDGDGMRLRLASVVEAEILPRLMLAHRGHTRSTAPLPGRRPMPEEVERLCALLLARSDADLVPHLLRFLDEGFTLESVLMELLTPMARHLGRLWEEDGCDFVDVTVALARLQAAGRDLCGHFEDGLSESAGRNVLLLPTPGETHIFCLSILAAIFRESGWDVTVGGQDGSNDAAELIRSDWYDVVGLTLSCDVLLPALSETIRMLRAVSCNPTVKVLVGGPYFARNPNHVRAVGADATADDGRLAPLIAESLLEMRTRAC